MGEDTNLLQETLKDMAEHGKAPGDVRWVGTGDEIGSWDEFAALADAEYYAGFGGNEVELELKVVGDDWWMERHEYDGSEWWEFKTLPTRPEGKPLSKLISRD